MGHSFSPFGFLKKYFSTITLTALPVDSIPATASKQVKPLVIKANSSIKSSKTTAYSFEENPFTVDVLPCLKPFTCPTNSSLNTFLFSKNAITQLLLCTPNNLCSPLQPYFQNIMLTSNRTIELSVIVPTYNEKPNVLPMIESLSAALVEYQWEVIFVDDDSPDGTAHQIRKAAKYDSRVRILHRIGRRGLSSAVIEGILASSSNFCAVIDGDLQHDEKLLSTMLNTIKEENLDLVSGSRYIEGGGLGDWQASRARISKLATHLSRAILHTDLTDPMSGFFMIRRSTFEKRMRNLSGIGFKILLDIIASSKEPLRYQELPYEFRSRQAGESKLDSQAAWDYFMLLLDKLIGHIVPVRFVAFTLVGAVGVIVHMFTVWLMLNYMGIEFFIAQITATLIAMTSNYALNNILTYRDMRLNGWNWLKGWVSFTLACGVGFLGNIGIATYIFEQGTTWVWASLSGIIIGAVWNYTVTSIYTWKKPRIARA